MYNIYINTYIHVIVKKKVKLIINYTFFLHMYKTCYSTIFYYIVNLIH